MICTGAPTHCCERVRRRSAGLDFSFIDLNDSAALKAALKPNTRMIWAETPTNPMLKLVDLAKIGAFARKHGLILVVDNTFCSPMLQRPLNTARILSCIRRPNI